MKQLAISVMPPENSSYTDHISIQSSTIDDSIFEQESTETQSSWSTDEGQVDLIEILKANQPATDQPSTNQPLALSGPTVSEAESDTDQTNPPPE
jgi:hypothetical protein